MQHWRRRNAHLRRHLGVRLEKPEVLEHGMVRRGVELAGNAISLRPSRYPAKLDAMRQRDLLAADEPPAEVEVPPRAAISTVGRQLHPDLFLLLDDGLDLAILDRLEIGGGDLAIRSFGARTLDRCRAQDRTDVIGAEGGFGSRRGGTHGGNSRRICS